MRDQLEKMFSFVSIVSLGAPKCERLLSNRSDVNSLSMDGGACSESRRIWRVAPSGTLAERSPLQPSLRGCDGESGRARQGAR